MNRLKYFVFFGAIVGLAGCASMRDREAPCRCFNSNGETNGSCNFERFEHDPYNYTVAQSTHQPSALAATDDGCGGV
ncbi:hypothetical protein V8J82_22410 [Gymnodinialimonas sp. 2305UL16-5]|uniref:hypothetical protein n=1 Tax=Gymnodinialimonas mytili TaxID=3126503 RepID=UPI0030A5DB11